MNYSGEMHSNCGGVHKVGESLTCYVTFARETDFTGLNIVFNLVGERKPGQRGAYLNLVLRESRKVGPRTYAVSGPVNDCVPGTYQLVAVTARTAQDWQSYSNFDGNLGNVSLIVQYESAEIPEPEAPQPSRPVALPSPPASPVPIVVNGPAPDPSIFTKVRDIRPAPESAPPVQGVVSVLRRIFRKPSPCGGSHRQGDMLACRISFEGRPQFHTVGLGFYQIGEPHSLTQRQLCTGFTIATHEAVPGAAGTYEVKGVVPKCGAGKYAVGSITAFSPPGDDTSKLYTRDYFNGKDFHSAVVLKIRDTSSRTFPPIVSVSATAPR